MIMKLSVILWAVLLLIPFVYADTYQSNTNVDVKVPCVNNNTYCTSSAFCGLTVYYPNGSLIVNNVSMQNQNAFFNYTLTSQQTSENGDYKATVICQDTNLNGFTEFPIQFTNSGVTSSLGDVLIYALSLLVAIVLMLICYFFSFTMNGNNTFSIDGVLLEINFNKYLKILLFGMGYLFMSISFFLAWRVSFNFLFLDFASGLFKGFYTMSTWLVFPMLLLLGFMLFGMIFQDIKSNNLAKRGLRSK